MLLVMLTQIIYTNLHVFKLWQQLANIYGWPQVSAVLNRRTIGGNTYEAGYFKSFYQRIKIQQVAKASIFITAVVIYQLIFQVVINFII